MSCIKCIIVRHRSEKWLAMQGCISWREANDSPFWHHKEKHETVASGKSG